LHAPTTPTTPDLEAPLAALAAARATREQYGGRPPSAPSDPERRVALRAALGLLRESWTAEHEHYVRSGRQVGRATSDDPVRVLRRDMRAEEARLRSALKRTSGTPRSAQAPWTAPQMRGRLLRFDQRLRELEAQHENIKAGFRSGGVRLGKRGGQGFYPRVLELRQEAADLLPELRRERRDVRTAWDRFERWTPPLNPADSYAASDTYDHLSAWLADLRDRADDLREQVRLSAERREPDAAAPAYRPRWTVAKVYAALAAHREAHGRLPTAREFNSDAKLPRYTTVRRLLGPRPLSRLR
jgi:hypothetical protein